MRRVPIDPRPGWQQTVASQGLVFATTTGDDGIERPWWHEQAYYELDMSEVDLLEDATARLHEMSLEAARFLATGAMGTLGIPPLGFEVVQESLRAMDAGEAPSLYGRLDLRWDGVQPPKLLEYNADTPTGLLEASVVQWFWLEDRFPELDQWNSLHERLVLGWQQMRGHLADAPVWFAHHEDEETGEELLTVSYLRDTAEQAGLSTAGTTMGDIGWDAGNWCFVGRRGVGGQGGDLWTPMRTCFKLYPWELMLAESFGAHVEARPSPARGTTWIEPPWKSLLSNKALLAALWHLYPDHELLLPAYLDGPHGMDAWVAKPLHGREGDGIRVHAPGIEIDPPPSGYGPEGHCWQQWAPLPEFTGPDGVIGTPGVTGEVRSNKVVLGSWLVDGHPAGLGIRESDGWVTDTSARFVPHVIRAPRPDAATRQEWIREDQ